MDPAQPQIIPKALEEMVVPPPPPPQPASPMSHGGEELPPSPPLPTSPSAESVVTVVGMNGVGGKVKKVKNRFLRFVLGGLGALVLVGGLGTGLYLSRVPQKVQTEAFSVADGNKCDPPGQVGICSCFNIGTDNKCIYKVDPMDGQCKSGWYTPGVEWFCGNETYTPTGDFNYDCTKDSEGNQYYTDSSCQNKTGTSPMLQGQTCNLNESWCQGGPTATPTGVSGDFKCKDKRAFKGTLDNRGNRINDGGNVKKGASFVYSIRVENTTAEQKDGEIRDVLPEFLTYESGEPGCSFDETTRRVTCNVNNVAVNQTKEKAFQVKVADDAPLGSFKNTARLAGQNSACDLDLNIVEAPTSDLQCVAKTAWEDAGKTVQIASGSNVARGKIFYYGIEAKNFGTVAADGRIEDVLPSQVEFQSFVNNADSSCTNTGNNITCTISGLAAGQSVSKLIKVKVADLAEPGSFTNPASVIPTLGDPTDCSLPLTVQVSNPEISCKQLKIFRGTPLVEIAAKDIRLGDAVTFRGFATATNASSVIIKFTLTKNGQVQTAVEKPATLVGGVYQADYEVSIDQATSYSMKTEPVTP